MSASADSPPEKKPALPFVFSARLGGLVTAGVLVLVALFFIIEALTLSLGSLKLPGPGFFPLTLGIVLLILGAVVAAGVRTEAADDETVELGHRDVLITILLLLLVPMLFEGLGAYLTLGGFSFLMLVLIARTRILVALPSVIVSMIVTWFFFQKMLGVSLPWGVLAEVVNR